MKSKRRYIPPPDPDPGFYKRPWTEADYEALYAFHYRPPGEMTLELFKLLLKARGCSEDVDLSERPCLFLPTLVEKYCCGPIDKNGIPFRFPETIN